MCEIVTMKQERHDYFKTNKPIPRNFVRNLLTENMVLAEDQIIIVRNRPDGEEIIVKLLFYRDLDGFLHMMIGIGDDELDSESSSDSSLRSFVSKDTNSPLRQHTF